MYKLRIHTVDDSSNPFPTTSSAAPGPKPSTNNKNDDFSHITELKGVVHLFRCLSPATASLTSPSSRSTTLLFAAVPNYLSREDFLTFCGPHLDHFSQLCFLRNDGMEDRYSVLITLVNQLRSDGFYCSFNGNLFRPSEVCRLCQQHDEEPECADCGTFENLWFCVICGFVGCGRYQEKHAVRHWEDAQHCFSLELESQRVWDYVGHIYVHRLNQSKADGKSAKMNSMSIHGECSTCGCSEDFGISEALYDSKVEAMADEYDRLFANEMETQRKRFESQLEEVKSKKERSISEAVEKALASRMQDIQSKLEHYDDVAVTHQHLMRRQEILWKVVKEKDERENSSVKSRDETIRDKEEQVNAGLECGIVTDDFYDEILLRLSRVWKRSGRLKRLQPRWQLQLKELGNDQLRDKVWWMKGTRAPAGRAIEGQARPSQVKQQLLQA